MLTTSRKALGLAGPDLGELALSLPPAQLSELGAVFAESLSFEDWRAMGRQIRRCDRALNWIRGDWFNAGQRFVEDVGQYPGQEDWARLSMAIGRLLPAMTDLELKSLGMYAYVARNVNFSTRVEGLSWSHHREVAYLPEKGQRAWLRRALEGEWSVADLRQAMAGKEREEPSSPVATFSPGSAVGGLVRWFACEEERIGKRVEDWPAARKDALKRELAPLVAIAGRL